MGNLYLKNLTRVDFFSRSDVKKGFKMSVNALFVKWQDFEALWQDSVKKILQLSNVFSR